MSAPLPLVFLLSEEVRELLEYTTTLPTGTTIGKRWKRADRTAADGWVLGEYVEHPAPDTIGIKWHEIVVIP